MAGIDSDLIRGHIDTIILKALYHGDKYGLEIIQEIEEKSNGTYELKQPTLYSCLKRLESQGLISSYWEDSEIGGKRHYYKLTEQGLATYKANQEEWLRSREIIDNLIYNTTIEYAPIYDDENEKKARLASKKQDEEIVNEAEQQQNTEENVENETLSAETTTPTDYQADDEQNDEFASFDNASVTADSFFNSNSESASEDEFDDQSPATIEAPRQTEPEHELVSLNLDTIAEEPEVTEDQTEEFEEDSDDTLLEEETTSEATLEDNFNEDDEIYTLNQDEDTDDQIYEPQNDEDQAEEIYTPTYINFGNNNYQEADLTSVTQDETEDEELAEEEPASADSEQEYNDYSYSQQDEAQTQEDDSIVNTANTINEQYYNTIPHASEEEINNLYRTTENYENLQAGYTDETYKQMLSVLESYSSTPDTAPETDKSSVPTIAELTDQFEAEGIILRKHTKHIKETDDSKMYVKTNQIHMVKNWMTFGITTLCMLLVFGIMSAFKDTYTYTFAFWQFVVAIAVSLIIPAYSTAKYFVNPYKKVVAKYAPRLSILLSVLITVQLILVVYCVNLQLGFYSFSQENYCHLLWILPLILSFTPIIQSLVYLPLYNSKRFHI